MPLDREYRRGAKVYLAKRWSVMTGTHEVWVEAGTEGVIHAFWERTELITCNSCEWSTNIWSPSPESDAVPLEMAYETSLAQAELNSCLDDALRAAGFPVKRRGLPQRCACGASSWTEQKFPMVNIFVQSSPGQNIWSLRLCDLDTYWLLKPQEGVLESHCAWTVILNDESL
jgi:hypothetical protein